jgi:SAM-dependent methyltransferase
MRLRHLAGAAARGLLLRIPLVRALKRRLVRYEDDPENSSHAVTDGLRQLRALRALGIPVAGATVLEFGCGWLPMIPLLHHLAGARGVVLADIERLMDAATLARAREVVALRLDDIAATLGETREALADRLAAPPPFDYRVPWDAARHPAASIDIVASRAVLEHVPEPALVGFLAAFRRILRPGGVMCHQIDNSDHWQHLDLARSRVGFLGVEETDWRWRLAQVNPLFHQNRLRHADYARLIGAAGFRIRHAEGTPHKEALADLPRIRLASRFAGRDPRDLAILDSFFVAQRD